MASPTDVRRALLEFALTLPQAYEDHPWGEDVVKVNKKIFVFLGMADAEHPSVGVKLPESAALALGVPGVRPSGYGLGKAGWVNVSLRHAPNPDVLLDWVEESYRAVAPKRLVTALDELTRNPPE